MTIADTSVALVTGNISTQSAAVISEAGYEVRQFHYVVFS